MFRQVAGSAFEPSLQVPPEVTSRTSSPELPHSSQTPTSENEVLARHPAAEKAAAAKAAAARLQLALPVAEAGESLSGSPAAALPVAIGTAPLSRPMTPKRLEALAAELREVPNLTLEGLMDRLNMKRVEARKGGANVSEPRQIGARVDSESIEPPPRARTTEGLPACEVSRIGSLQGETPSGKWGLMGPATEEEWLRIPGRPPGVEFEHFQKWPEYLDVIPQMLLAGSSRSLSSCDRIVEGILDDQKNAEHVVVHYSNGNLYEGALVDGFPHGRGRMQFGKQDPQFNFREVYEGEWMRGAPCGEGVCDAPNGTHHQGGWWWGVPHGPGVHQWPNGGVMTGTFILRNPFGKLIAHYPDGSSFEGEVMMGNFCGPGRFMRSNGDILEGEFKNNCLQGWGTLTTRGSVITGYFEKDQPQHGRQVHMSGLVYNGEFYHGRRHGLGTARYPDGHAYSGPWADGLEHGLGQLAFPSGRELVVEYDQGRISSLGPDARENGVLVPELRYLWRSTFPPNREEISALAADPEMRQEIGWKEWLGSKKFRWIHIFKTGTPQAAARLFVEALTLKGCTPHLEPARHVFVELCLKHPEALDPFRREGILPPSLRWLWKEGLALTVQEASALVLHPGRFQPYEPALATKGWSKERWELLLDLCGPLKVLHFIQEHLPASTWEKLPELVSRLAMICTQAPELLRDLRSNGMLPRGLQRFWAHGLPMTRPEVFALFDDEALRREVADWPALVKRWPEPVWSALLMERGLRKVLDFLNQRDAKEWRALSLLERRGLEMQREGSVHRLVSPTSDDLKAASSGRAKQAQGAASSRLAEQSGSQLVTASSAAAPMAPAHFEVIDRVAQQLLALPGLAGEAFRAWIENAARGWFSQQRPDVVSHRGRSWLHAHIHVPGGALYIVGYLLERTGAKCTVGWLMEGHNYQQKLQAALPSEEQLAQTQTWSELRNRAGVFRPDSPESDWPISSPVGNSPVGEAREEQAFATRRREQTAALLGALRGGWTADFSQPVPEDLTTLAALEQRAGILEVSDLPFEDRLAYLEDRSGDLLVQVAQLLGLPSPVHGLERGPRQSALAQLEQLYAIAVDRVARRGLGQPMLQPDWSSLIAGLEEQALETRIAVERIASKD